MSYSIQDFLNIKAAVPAGFSPDGSKVLISSNLTGTLQLYRVGIRGGELVQLTDLEEPVTGSYLPTKDQILVQMDEGGNERVQIYLLDDDGKELQPVVYEPDYIHRVGGVARDSSSIVYASNRRNGVDFDIYVRNLTSGEEKRVFDLGGLCMPGGFSPNRRFISVMKPSDRSGDNDLYLVDLQTDEVMHLTPHDDDSFFGLPKWLPDSSSFFFATDAGSEFQAVARYDLSSRGWKIELARDHDLSCEMDWNLENLIVTETEHGFTTTEVFDPQTLSKKFGVSLPRRGIASEWYSKDGRLFTYGFQSPVDSGDAWLFDWETGETTRLTNSPGSIPPEDLVEPQVHSYESFDGERIPILLFKPKQSSSEKPPVVVSIHGGPESQFMPILNPVIQYLVHRGFAVVAPNVRGSTGYGKRYHHLDDKRNRLDSVRDLEGLHRWLGTVGLDDKRAALMGGSYGGYMVLAGLTFQPDLWAAGIDIVGISSLVTFLENTSAWRREFREREYGSLGEDREFLIEASPLTHIDNIKAPLFIIHGRNDPRVPVGEAEQIHDVLRSKGIPSELLIYEDEGHGLQKLKNRLDSYPKVVNFLERVLSNLGQ